MGLADAVTEQLELFRPYIIGVNSILDIGTGTSIPAHIIAEAFPSLRIETVDIEDMRQKKTGFAKPFGQTLSKLFKERNKDYNAVRQNLKLNF